ncbi:MAG: GNAT family N-acetyltransferase [Methylobacteriaceae bacterium]|nr:GNAT family N-acetyltransferase [Methylobacteriaceae bacterium]
MNAPAQLETARLTLRPWAEDDVGPFATLYADDGARFVGGRCTTDEVWRRMACFIGHWALRGYGFWALEEKANGHFVGFSGLWYPHGWPEHEVGWSLVPAARGRGFATEAAAAARAIAYGHLKWTTLVSYIAPGNDPSRRVAERLGAAKGSMIKLRGQDAVVYRHPPPETLEIEQTCKKMEP